MRGHAGNRRFVEQVGRVFEQRAQSFGRLLHLQREIELRCGMVYLDRIEREPRQLQCFRRGVVQREDHLEQRIAAHVALGPHLLHQPVEGQVLVREGVQAHFAHAG